MNAKVRIVVIFALVLIGGTALVAMGMAAPGIAPLAGGAPTVVAYQGEVRMSGVPYTGDGYFKFAVVNISGDTSYWSNDGTSTGGNPPSAAVPLAVSDGLFSVLLGDATLPGMTQPLTADVFGGPDRYLRVWFSTGAGGPFDLLAPDTRIAAVPYALQAQEAANADTVDGLHASELGTHYQNVVVVAKSGGDYASVQAAIDSITDAAADNAYLVWVAPGVYEEQVTMKPYVHLQGAGQEATVITSNASSGAWPPDQATLVLASDTSLRDLAVGNSGAGDVNAALLATPGTAGTVVTDAEVRSYNGGVSNLAVVLHGSGTGITLQQVTAVAEDGTGFNGGLYIADGAAAVLRGGTFTGRGGQHSRGIVATGSGTELEAWDATALSENASEGNVALYNGDGAAATLHRGSFEGRGGAAAWGINNSSDAATSTLAARDVEALAEDGSGYNCGLDNHGYAAASLHGGSFTARGGGGPEGIKGIHNSGGGSTLHAVDVTALAENGSTYNYGLHNADGASTTLRGGAFTGRGGTDGYGILNEEATLDAQTITALGENGGTYNTGLGNRTAAQAMLYGSAFTARGGTEAYGIYNGGANALLEAESATVMAQDSSAGNYGLLNQDGAAAILQGGSFTARGGHDNYGLYNDASGTTLAAESVTVLAENGSSTNHGLVNESGAAASLHGGSFTGRSGEYTRGIFNVNGGSVLEAEGVKVSGEDGSNTNYGLLNQGGAGATLRGGTFTGRGGTFAYGIDNQYGGPMLEAEEVTVMGTDGSEANYGLRNAEGAHARLRGGSFTAQWGITSCAIDNVDVDTWLEADNVSALAENGSDENYGLDNHNSAGASLSGGSFTARWGTDSFGIHNAGSNTSLQANNVTARGELGSGWNFGLSNSSAAWARLHGGAFLASGGTDAQAIYNSDSDTWLEADNVTGLAENGNSNYGLVNLDAATAKLRGSDFTGRGGTYARGILNEEGNGVTLEADNVTALGESGSWCVGLTNYGAAVLRGSDFTGRGGQYAWGVLNESSGVMLEAESVTALGENGSAYSIGLVNYGNAVLRGGVFTGRAGYHTRGIYNANPGVTLMADNVTARGKDGSGTNYGLHNYGDATADLSQAVLEGAHNGLYQDSGTVHLAVNELDGGATRSGGTLTCYQVYDGNYAAYTCP